MARRRRVARRRRLARRLGGFAWAILTAAPEARALTPAGWLFLSGWLAIVAQATEFPAFAAASGALFVLLAVAALVDGLYLVLPNGPLLALAGLAPLVRVNDSAATIPASAAAALVAYAFFSLFARIHAKITGRPVFHDGDARLFAVAGLWLGFDGLPTCLLIAAVSGLISSALAGRDAAPGRNPAPFGPHLALGLWLTWLFGPLALEIA